MQKIGFFFIKNLCPIHLVVTYRQDFFWKMACGRDWALARDPKWPKMPKNNLFYAISKINEK